MSNQVHHGQAVGDRNGVLPERLFTLNEAAAELHASVKPAALRAAINEGRLVARKVGRTLLIAESDLRDYLEECRTCPAPAKAPASASSARMSATAPRSEKGSGITDGTSSGRKQANGVSERRASIIAQQLKSAKRPSPASSPSRREGAGQPAPVIPIRSP